MSGLGTATREIKDTEGSTIAYSGTATTTPANVPSSAGNIISAFGLENTGNNDMQISMDGGTTYFSVGKGEFLSWTVKGNITQVSVQTPSSTTTYQILINFEDN